MHMHIIFSAECLNVNGMHFVQSSKQLLAQGFQNPFMKDV